MQHINFKLIRPVAIPIRKGIFIHCHPPMVRNLLRVRFDPTTYLQQNQ